MDVLEVFSVNNAEHHAPFVLIKPFLSKKPTRYEFLVFVARFLDYLCFVHVVVIPLIGSTHNHNNIVFSRVETKVVHRRLEFV